MGYKLRLAARPSIEASTQVTIETYSVNEMHYQDVVNFCGKRPITPHVSKHEDAHEAVN